MHLAACLSRSKLNVPRCRSSAWQKGFRVGANHYRWPISEELKIEITTSPEAFIEPEALREVLISTAVASTQHGWEYGAHAPLVLADNPFNSTVVAPEEAGRNCTVVIWSETIVRPGQADVQMTYEWLHETLVGLVYYFALPERKVVSDFKVEHNRFGVIGKGRVEPAK